MKHQPTPPARCEDTLRYLAEVLLRDARRWGYTVVIAPDGKIDVVALPTLYANGVNDDTAGFQAMIDGRPFIDMRGPS